MFIILYIFDVYHFSATCAHVSITEKIGIFKYQLLTHVYKYKIIAASAGQFGIFLSTDVINHSIFEKFVFVGNHICSNILLASSIV